MNERRLIITWPPVGELDLPWSVMLTDADTGEKLMSVLRLVVEADCNNGEPIMADLVLLADKNGEPLHDVRRVVTDKNGAPRTTTARWPIVGMRVASDEGRADTSWFSSTRMGLLS